MGLKLTGDVFGAVREAAAAAREAGELPGFMAELERIRWEVAAPAPAIAPVEAAPQKDRVLDADETAKRCGGKSRWWVYAHKNELPLVRLPGGRLGFSEKGLERWIQRRRA